jgi:hypothetical protein
MVGAGAGAGVVLPALGLVSVAVLRRGAVVVVSLRGESTGVLGVVLELVLVVIEEAGPGVVVWTSAGTVGVMSEGGMGDMEGQRKRRQVFVLVLSGLL